MSAVADAREARGSEKARRVKKIAKKNEILETVTEEIALATLHARGNGIERLTFADRHLVPLALEAEGETCRMTFDVRGLQSLEKAREESQADQYRLLANVLELAELRRYYGFDLSPDNLYYDRNLSIHVLRRDAPNGEAEDDFLEQYHCLCGHVLQKRYSFDAYRKGGAKLLDKHRRLRELRATESAAGTAAHLAALSDAERAKVKRTKRLIGRKSFVAIVASLVVAVLVAGGSAAYAGNYIFFRQPYEQRLMRAGNAYLADDYDGVITAVREDAIGGLPKETRYILARSYVQAESLSQEQKANILSLLTLKSDDTLLNYWIELGRNNYAGARDIAERIQNDEWLLYCLLKQEVDVRNSTTISGAEKTSQLEGLNEEIDALTEKLGGG